MLQMISHGLIGASLFFLVGATYDRTHTLLLDEMGGIGQKMRIMFALWTVCALASLALPGMSGFVSELMIFAGFATDEAYTLPFRAAASKNTEAADANQHKAHMADGAVSNFSFEIALGEGCEGGIDDIDHS